MTVSQLRQTYRAIVNTVRRLFPQRASAENGQTISGQPVGC